MRPVVLDAVHIRANAGGVHIAGLGQLVEYPSETSHRPGTTECEAREANGIERLCAQPRPGVSWDGDMVDFGNRDACLPKAVTDRVGRKAGGVFDAIETLLLGRGHELTVADDCARSVPVVGVDPEDDH